MDLADRIMNGSPTVRHSSRLLEAVREASERGTGLRIGPKQCAELLETLIEASNSPFDSELEINAEDLSAIGLKPNTEDKPKGHRERNDRDEDYGGEEHGEEGGIDDVDSSETISTSQALVAPTATPGFDEYIPQSAIDAQNVLDGVDKPEPISHITNSEDEPIGVSEPEPEQKQKITAPSTDEPDHMAKAREVMSRSDDFDEDEPAPPVRRESASNSDLNETLTLVKNFRNKKNQAKGKFTGERVGMPAGAKDSKSFQKFNQSLSKLA